jgi:hypothetical protein
VGVIAVGRRHVVGPGWDQSADGARLHSRGRRKSAQILPEPNRALGQRPTRFSTAERSGWEAFEGNLSVMRFDHAFLIYAFALRPSNPTNWLCLLTPSLWKILRRWARPVLRAIRSVAHASARSLP